MLLLAGAKTRATNTVSRTPSQMAAFVGNHNCVATINNFVSKSEVDCYTVIRGTQTEPHLPPFLAESFHKFIMGVNIHPVRIALNLNNLLGLSDHLKEVKKVLELMRDREMKQREINEVLSFKFHYLSCVVGEIIKLKSKSESEDKKSDLTETFSKKMLKSNKEGTHEYMEAFLKESVREFPYRESMLFRQIVATIANKDSPPTLSVITSAINGQRGFIDNVPICNTCGEEKPGKKCSKCKVVQYCDRNCQRLHWFIHKKACDRLGQSMSDGATGNEKSIDTHELSKELHNILA